MKQITQKDEEWQATEAIKCRIQEPNSPAVLRSWTMNKVELCDNRLRKSFLCDFNRLHRHIEVVVTLVVAFFEKAVEVDSSNVQAYAKKRDNAANDAGLCTQAPLV